MSTPEIDTEVEIGAQLTPAQAVAFRRAILRSAIGADVPEPWMELIEALTIMAKGAEPRSHPTICTHDFLYVTADPKKFTDAELEHLDRLGFHPDTYGESFSSSKFGSA
jgi:hypothetical protein